jgi:hypothetical protein
MEYREIVAVTSLGGLYQLLSTKSDGAIVRSVADKTTKFISARQHNVTPLESIEVYTTGDNVRLQVVFQKMSEHEAKLKPSDVKTSDNAAIKGYFKSILPEFDEERVYVSDMKKMLKWYEILKANDLLRFEEEVEEAPAEAAPVVAEVAPEEGEAKPKKAAAKKKAAATEEEAPGEEKPAKKAAATEEEAPGEEKPAKKAAAKKKVAATEEAPAKKVTKKKKTEE